MVFTSNVFMFLFLPILLIFYFGVFRNNIRMKNLLLCVSSLLFYAWGEPIVVFLMIISIIVNYFFGLCMKFRNKKAFLILSVIYNLSFLFVFKYFNFTSDVLGSIFGINFIKINVGLPIGISFYTFQIMSYVIDVYRGEAQPQKNIINLALYISLFPQLVAGPIVRYNTVEYEIMNRKENTDMFKAGVERFIIGFAKKLVIANNVGFIVDNIYALNTDSLTTAFLWLAAIAYTLQIYFDFSAYSDMAIGLGKMFGFNFEENFNYPYVSKSITEFWRRWHISLSTWLRDYLYIPLGGNRVSKTRHIFNLFFTWFCTGLWHGANFTFIVWGIYFFVFLLLEKYLKCTKKLGAFSHVYTLLVVIISWVIFRAENMGLAIEYIKGMFAFNLNSFLDSDFIWYIKNFAIVLIIAIVFSMPVAKYIKKILNKVPCLEEIALTAILLISVSFMLRSTYNPFIYFNF
ncbi:MAG: MBOAT family protein [Clostridia bacterium]|nr:MBOAT family protein [Clostridia bacterium]